MRILVAPAGSRGDFQPLLALAIALRRAGHDVLMLTAPDFAREAGAFGVPSQALGPDAEQHVRGGDFSRGPLRGSLALMGLGRRLVAQTIEAALPLARGAELIIGAGAQIVAPTVAELVGADYLYVGYTPQVLPSSHHPPMILPLLGLPPWGNRLLWWLFDRAVRAAFGAQLNRKRAELGLPAVLDFLEHVAPRGRSVVAADPELAPVSADLALAHPLTGALHLPDERPLPASLESFLAAGPPPLYIGFGSMPDFRPQATLQVLVAAARAAGCRLVLSSGWARFAAVSEGAKVLSDDVIAVGPTSHALLFPRVAAVVHHGGAGTTSAALRAGRPQLLIPHLFDQFQWGQWVARAGLGPEPLSRRRLSPARLTAKLNELLTTPRFKARAAELASSVRARDAAAELIAVVAGSERRHYR